MPRDERVLCTLRRKMIETAAAVGLMRKFGHKIADTRIAAGGSVAGSCDTQNFSSVVAKDGGQEESEL